MAACIRDCDRSIRSWKQIFVALMKKFHKKKKKICCGFVYIKGSFTASVTFETYDRYRKFDLKFTSTTSADGIYIILVVEIEFH